MHKLIGVAILLGCCALSVLYAILQYKTSANTLYSTFCFFVNLGSLVDFIVAMKLLFAKKEYSPLELHSQGICNVEYLDGGCYVTFLRKKYKVFRALSLIGFVLDVINLYIDNSLGKNAKYNASFIAVGIILTLLSFLGTYIAYSYYDNYSVTEMTHKKLRTDDNIPIVMYSITGIVMNYEEYKKLMASGSIPSPVSNFVDAVKKIIGSFKKS